MSGSFPQLAIQAPDILGGLARVQGIQANRLQMLAAQQQMDDQRSFRDAAPDLLPALGTAEGPQRQNILSKIAGLGERGAGIALPMMQQDRERSQFQEIMRQTFGGGAPTGMPPASPNPVGAPAPPRNPALGSVVADLEGNGMPLEDTPRPNPQQPRGIRNNNPLNIVAGSFTQGMPGFAGSDGRFARFQSPEQGIAAADALLSSYARRGINTPMALVTRWAPPGDGNNNPPAYATAVARALGVGVNDQIDLNDPATRQRVISAMAQVENGQPLQGAAPQGAPAPGMQSPAPQRAGLPTVEQLAQLAQSGNPQAMAYVQRMAPLVQQANPNFQFQNIGGTLYAIHPQNPNDRRAIGPAGDPRLLNPEEEAQRIRLARAGAPTTTLNTERTFTGQLAERGANQIAEMRQTARTAADGIRTADRIDALLSSGVITGTAAETRLGIERALRTAGLIDGRRVANTEQLITELARSTLPMAEALPGALSNNDLAFIREAAAGRLEFSAETMARVASLTREIGERSIQSYNDVAGTLQGDQSLPEAMRQLYAPITRPTRPTPPAPQGAPSAPIGATGMTASPPPPQGAPAPGTVEGGFRFRGGNPADPSSWERVQ